MCPAKTRMRFCPAKKYFRLASMGDIIMLDACPDKSAVGAHVCLCLEKLEV